MNIEHLGRHCHCSGFQAISSWIHWRPSGKNHVSVIAILFKFPKFLLLSLPGSCYLFYLDCRVASELIFSCSRTSTKCVNVKCLWSPSVISIDFKSVPPLACKNPLLLWLCIMLSLSRVFRVKDPKSKRPLDLYHDELFPYFPPLVVWSRQCPFTPFPCAPASAIGCSSFATLAFFVV